MPVIVTGTGRCGSSAVARVLHEQLGVYMGERFDRIRPPNPEGTYEDLDFRDLHVSLGRRELEREDFEERARELIAARNVEHGERWGFKDPRASTLLDFYLDEIPGALVVVPYRDRAAVATSIHRHYGTLYEVAEFETEKREAALMRTFNERVPITPIELETGEAADPVWWLFIDMNRRRANEWLVERLSRRVRKAFPEKGGVSA